MPKTLEEIAQTMGAQIKAILPDVGDGFLAGAYHAKFYQQQMQAHLKAADQDTAKIVFNEQKQRDESAKCN